MFATLQTAGIATAVSTIILGIAAAIKALRPAPETQLALDALKLATEAKDNVQDIEKRLEECEEDRKLLHTLIDSLQNPGAQGKGQ